jgi:IS4 transposase
MQRINRGDTMIFDRGYYSKPLLQAADRLAIKVVFRLKMNAFKDTEGVFRTAYLYKYCIDQKVYVCLTNYMTSIEEVKHLYKLRWTVETSFAVLKAISTSRLPIL